MGSPRKDCKQQAKEALKRFKTLRGVLEAPPEELQQIDGIGPHSTFGIKLVQEVAREFLKEKIIDKPIYKSTQDIFDYLYNRYHKLKESIFILFFMRISGLSNNHWTNIGMNTWTYTFMLVPGPKKGQYVSYCVYYTTLY
ncbi:hypothetical protein ACFLUR_04320 [Chloroflexota bacterium]